MDDDTPHGDPDLIWVRDIVTQFGQSADWAYDWANKGKLHPIKFPGDTRTYFSRAEIRALLASRLDAGGDRAQDRA